MKKTISIIFSLIIALSFLLAMPLSANAAETTAKDGIEVTISTNKDSYKTDDTIRISVKVKNNNNFAVSGINIETLIPDDFEFVDDEAATKTIDLNENGVRIVSAKVKYTGKDNSNLLLIVLAVLAAVVLIVLIVCIALVVNKKKNATRVMSILLCLVMMFSIMPFNLMLASAESEITVDKTVDVGKEAFTFKASAKFTAEDLSNTIFANLAASEQFFVLNESGSVTINATLKTPVSVVELFDSNDQKLSDMYDDGTNGDTVAGDNIYSCTIDVYETAESKLDFYARADGQRSQPLSVYYFGTPSDQEVNDFHSAEARIEAIEDDYASSDDTVPENQIDPLLAEVLELIEELFASFIIVDYELTESSIYVKFASGMTYVYTPRTEGYYSISSSQNMSVSVYQPSYDWIKGKSDELNYIALPSGISNEADLFSGAGSEIASTFENYSFTSSTMYTNSSVTLDSVKNIGANQIVLWQGHGTWAGSKLHSVISTGKEFDWEAWFWDLTYFADSCKGRIVYANGAEAFSYKYVDKYCGNLTNTFIYLGPCESGYDDVLAQTFINKGASAVIANTKSIRCRYGDMIEYTVAHLLTQINPATNNYYTLGEALAKAKSTYGESDSGYGGKGAVPTLFGGDAAYNYRLGDYVEPEIDPATSGQLSGRICKASDRSTAIPGAVITVYSGSTLVSTSNADANGNYSISLPEGNYTVKITSSGYIEFRSYATVIANSNTYMETFLMIQGSSGQSGTASGQVYNSLTGEGLSGVRLAFKKDWNNTSSSATTVATATTDSSGNYSVNLPIGNYTVIATKDGYSASSFNIIVQPGSTGNQNGTITPVISGDDYLITLTWNEYPEDIDSHMYGPTSNGGEFHVYYGAMQAVDGGEEICNLDYDDMHSFGPEHITLVPNSDGPYYYFVYNYSKEAPLNASGAKVTVEQGNVVVAEFNIPTNTSDNYYWNVFAIVDGELVVNNTLTSSPNTSYAG